MSERRDFLKAASLIPVGGLAASAVACADQQVVHQKAGDPPAGDAPPVPVPPREPITEQSFPNYHLLGKPDAEANLLGAVRPRDWKETKTRLEEALTAAAVAQDPIHNWLATFRGSFDDTAADIVVKAGGHIHRAGQPNELAYEPQLYEASLRGAAALLDRCLRNRNEMGGCEISGVNAGIGYLTFLKLKPLQRNFLTQSNSADLAKIEKTTDTQASQKYGQVGGLDRLFEKYQLQAKQIELAGAGAEAGLAEEKNNFLTHLLERQFHIQIDAQLAQFTRLLQPGSSSNFAERYLRLVSLLTEDLADAYCKLYSASKGVQQVLGMSTVTVGMNAPVNVDIPLFAAPAAVKSWVDLIVPPQAGNQRKPDVLDALVLWCRAVMRTLDAAAQYESEFSVSLPLNQPWGPAGSTLLTPSNIATAFTGGNPTGVVSFTLPNNSLPISVAQTNIRVIGIGLSVEHSQDDASPIQYITGFPHTPSVPNVPVNQTPADSNEPTLKQIEKAQEFELPRMARLHATVTTPAQVMQGGTTYSRPRVFLANVRIQGGSGGDLEPVICYDPACRGLNPFGKWSITFDPNIVAFYQSAAAITDTWITGLILHLRLRGTLS